VKPIPKYLLSHAFWEFFLVHPESPLSDIDKDEIAKAAQGFLRSYSYLIQHKSDFILARDDKHILIPKGIRYAEFIRFIIGFQEIHDSAVSRRYSFGELRLTRLNFWAIVAVGRFTFHKTTWQYSAYFAKFYGPILFIFGIFSIVLSAMQVALAVQQSTTLDQSWATFAEVCRVFSIIMLVITVLVVLFLLLALLSRTLRELIFAVRIFWTQSRPYLRTAATV
jgi:hypothetical protein